MGAPGAREVGSVVSLPRRRFLRWTSAAVVATVPGSVFAGGCARGRPVTSHHTPGPVVDLPAARTAGLLSLEEALRARHSVRTFGPGEPSLGDIGQLLWAAQGVTHEAARRTAPSAGALYALELYAAVSARTLRYVPDGHRVEEWALRDQRHELAAAAGRPPSLTQATLVVVVTVTPSRLAGKYGSRAIRFADLEAGHATQGLLLQAVSLGLGAVPVGSFDEVAVASLLELPNDEVPRYLVAAGRPAGA
jgi:SagB-type dehydrogenase family enzyme